VRRFETEFLEYVSREHGGVFDSVRESRAFDEDTESALSDAYDGFADQFETSEGGSIKSGREEHEALDDEDVDQEQIKKQKRG